MNIFLEGDFPSGVGDCEHHCYPTCHPLTGDELGHYGCQHYAWPSNRVGDFVPLVKCDGDRGKCEIPDKFLQRMISGRSRRMQNAFAKGLKYQTELDELRALLREKQFSGVVL